VGDSDGELTPGAEIHLVSVSRPYPAFVGIAGEAAMKDSQVELGALQAEVDELKTEVAQLRAERTGSGAAFGLPHEDEKVSRRRMFGVLGGAAAAGTGLALAASPAGADDAGVPNPALAHITIANGTTGAGNSAGAATTSMTSSVNTVSDGAFKVINSAGGTAISATAVGGPALLVGNTSTSNPAAVIANAGAGRGLNVASNGTRPQIGITASGSVTGPPSGANNAGDIFVDQTGNFLTCVSGGSPGLWADLTKGGNLILLSAPIRVYDSRPGQPNAGGTPQGAISFTSAPPSANARTVNCDTAAAGGLVPYSLSPTALLMNLAIVTLSGVGALAVYQTGVAQPDTANINWSAGGQVLSNMVVSASASPPAVDVAIVAAAGGSTHFIIDIIGYSQAV
jgi:hypothetical protein